MFFALEHARGQLNIFNLGPDSTATLPTVAQTVIEEMGLQGVKIRYRGGDRGWPGDVPRAQYSVEKLASLGWRAKLTSDQAVRRAVQAILVEREEADSNCPAVRTAGSSP